MRAVLLDLDNTLYPESAFVKSGFRCVARYLSTRYGFMEDQIFTGLIDVLRKQGRGKVFDCVLQNIGLYSEARVRLLLSLYRSHRPTIRLYEGVAPTLHELRKLGLRLGLLTDGAASVQRSKIAALGAEAFFDAIVCTDELGRDCCKPSVLPYEVALELLQVDPSQAAYVGDDSSKDFTAPHALGMQTILVMRDIESGFAISPTGKVTRATFSVRSLEQIVTLVREEQAR